MVLDDFKDQPIIVRSSSLLEDRTGASFSGKYKSLFLANQGSKQERLEALEDAIAEVYASTFGPDPIGYRAERGPARFRRRDGHHDPGSRRHPGGGLLSSRPSPASPSAGTSSAGRRGSSARTASCDWCPGLGTRAVDRTSDDYPVLIAPGQVGLRVNVTADEIVRYAPKKVDVINLKTNSFETIEIKELLKKCGEDIPAVDKIVSVYDGQCLRKPLGKAVDFEKDDLVVTFEGLVSRDLVHPPAPAGHAALGRKAPVAGGHRVRL